MLTSAVTVQTLNNWETTQRLFLVIKLCFLCVWVSVYVCVCERESHFYQQAKGPEIPEEGGLCPAGGEVL